MTDLEVAWAAVHAALPQGWTVNRREKHIEEPHRPWHVLAADHRPRRKRPDYVEATGWTEAEALRDLAMLLRGWHVEDAEAEYR